MASFGRHDVAAIGFDSQAGTTRVSMIDLSKSAERKKLHEDHRGTERNRFAEVGGFG
jgi:hypothetical protein